MSTFVIRQVGELHAVEQHPKDRLTTIKEMLVGSIPNMTNNEIYQMFKSGNNISMNYIQAFEAVSFQEAVDAAEKIKAALGPEFTGIVKIDKETHKIEVIRR